MKLNLGSGDIQMDGYENIDIKTGRATYPLDYEDDSIDEIRASHILEHFPHRQVLEVLRHWVSKLKQGGVLKIAVPDFKVIVDAYSGGKKINVVGYIMGGQIDENDYHKCLFDRSSLTQLMQAAGLGRITDWKTEIADCASLAISLNLQGIKMEQQVERPVKVAAVMSMPRLAHTENVFQASRVFFPMQIPLTKGTGVFWGQVLTRQMEACMDNDYIITLDYDTWFTENHVIRLLQLMQENPEIDALIPVQLSREQDTPLVGIRDAEGKVVTHVSNEDLSKPLIQIASGHFGLSVFRVTSLKRLKKPWFVPIPDPNGSWNEGRQDEDIYFWNNMAACGMKVCMANEVKLGHIQMVATFPGTPENNWQPIHVYMNDVENGNVPEHCIPKVEMLK